MAAHLAQRSEYTEPWNQFIGEMELFCVLIRVAEPNI
jgi:hypothetical protein